VSSWDLAVDRVAEYGKDPVLYVHEVFGPGYQELYRKPLEIDPAQEDFLRALVTWRKGHYAIAASKGVGKTAGMAWAGWWFLDTRYDPNIIATSITGDNLKTESLEGDGRLVLALPAAGGVRAWTRRRSFFAAGRRRGGVTRVSFPKDADTTQQANTLAGLHSRARHVPRGRGG
jgi:hypothetical protein